MDRWKKRTLILIILPVFLVTLTATPAPAQGGPGDSAEMVYIILDIFLARPSGLVITALGAGFFVVTLPLSAPLQDHEKMLRVFILEPVDFTFIRPLGEF